MIAYATAEMDAAHPCSLDELAARTMDPLTELGIRHGTDKVAHGFCAFYHHHLAASRPGVSKVLEIGVFRGASLRMWRDYFPHAEIHGFDSQKTELTPESRVHLHVGDQADRHSLNSLLEATGSPFDLIIDDGGHTMEQQQVSFACLFPHLRPGCPYIIEDLHTSFFPTIVVRRGDSGLIVGSYPTGCDKCSCTTYQLVDALVRGQPVHSEFLSESEKQYLMSEVESAEVFDRDGDRAHITSIIRKKPSMMRAQAQSPQAGVPCMTPGRGESLTMSDPVRLYVDLLKKCVSNSINDDDLDMRIGTFAVDSETRNYRSVEPAPATGKRKHLGWIWPTRALTMIGIPRLDNIQYCVEKVLKDQVSGDLIETGVWRGGAVIFMRGLLKAHGVTDRTVWVADSFEGLPKADYALYPKESEVEFHKFELLAVSIDEVRENFHRYGLLDDQVRFLKGWFRDTLPTAPVEELAVMRLDGDLYESTMDALVNLYDKVSVGGFVIIDDYNSVKSCNHAVDDFRRQRHISTELSLIPGAGAFWRKGPNG